MMDIKPVSHCAAACTAVAIETFAVYQRQVTNGIAQMRRMWRSAGNRPRQWPLRRWTSAPLYHRRPQTRPARLYIFMKSSNHSFRGVENGFISDIK